MLRSAALIALLAGFGAGCAAPVSVPTMGSAEIVSDFQTYQIRRVGFLPFRPLHAAQLTPREVGSIETIEGWRQPSCARWPRPPLHGAR